MRKATFTDPSSPRHLDPSQLRHAGATFGNAMNAIERNGSRIADLELPVCSLFEDEDVVVAFRLSGRADGPVPAVEAYGRTSHFDKDLGDWVDDTVLVPLDVSDVRLEDGPPYPALAFRIRARVDCDPAVAIVTWEKD